MFASRPLSPGDYTRKERELSHLCAARAMDNGARCSLRHNASAARDTFARLDKAFIRDRKRFCLPRLVINSLFFCFPSKLRSRMRDGMPLPKVKSASAPLLSCSERRKRKPDLTSGRRLSMNKLQPLFRFLRLFDETVVSNGGHVQFQDESN